MSEQHSTRQAWALEQIAAIEQSRIDYIPRVQVARWALGHEVPSSIKDRLDREFERANQGEPNG